MSWIHTQLKFENFEAPGERKCQFHHVKSTLNLNPVTQKPLQWQHWYQRDGEKSQKRGNPSQERQRRSNRETGPKKSRQKGTFFIFVFVTHTHAREQSPATSRNYPRKLEKKKERGEKTLQIKCLRRLRCKFVTMARMASWVSGRQTAQRETSKT